MKSGVAQNEGYPKNELNNYMIGFFVTRGSLEHKIKFPMT